MRKMHDPYSTNATWHTISFENSASEKDNDSTMSRLSWLYGFFFTKSYSMIDGDLQYWYIIPCDDVDWADLRQSLREWSLACDPYLTIE